MTNKSKIDVQPIADKFRRSAFWRDGKRFKPGDIASFCRCSNYEAKLALRILPVHDLGSNVYTASRVHPLAHAVWRKPLPWDGEHTPRYF